jgi:hypothetical protein
MASAGLASPTLRGGLTALPYLVEQLSRRDAKATAHSDDRLQQWLAPVALQQADLSAMQPRGVREFLLGKAMLYAHAL